MHARTPAGGLGVVVLAVAGLAGAAQAESVVSQAIRVSPGATVAMTGMDEIESLFEDRFSPEPDVVFVPAPGAVALAGLGLGAMVWRKRR